jgi:CDP-diacylglycerol---serine O-phosphatidyltransferase
MKKRIYLLPNAITAFGLSCALFIIFRLNVLNLNTTSFEIIRDSSILLLIAALADLLDGAVARLTNTESEFGMLFDSISDAITFGLTPPIIILQSIRQEQTNEFILFLTLSAMIFTLCGVLRLVRFSVKPPITEPPLTLIQKKNFTGLPIPAGGCGAVSMCLALFSPEVTHYIPLSITTKTWILIGTLTLLGYLMISRWRFPSLKGLRLRIQNFNLVILLVIIAFFVLYGIHSHFSLLFFLTSWMYITISLVLSFIRLLTGKRVKGLSDFERSTEEELELD